MSDSNPSAMRKIFRAAAGVVRQVGLDGLSLADVAKDAGLPIGQLTDRFPSRHHLVIETHRATFRAVHERFEERFAAGEQGMTTAIDALDALWDVLRELQPFTPFLLATLTRATRDEALAERLASFNAEAATRLELGLIRAFPDQLHALPLPPDRLGRAVRTGLYGLLVELAQARTEQELLAVEQTYQDVRGLLAIVLVQPVAKETAH
ncbi:MAG: TetR family transcriptional regulator [Myxococcota bacterium]